jgi:hypothetical protein
MADDLTSQIQQARSAGYSDDDIAAFLAQKRPDLAPKITTARSHGYNSGEIIAFLSNAPTTSPVQPTEFEQMLNTAPQGVSGPLALAYGVGTGAIKGTLSTGESIEDIIRRQSGQPETLTPEQRQWRTVPSIPGQGTGKFLEQTAEFVAPSTLVGAGMERLGLPVAARMAGQSAIGGLVSGAQSGGDPTSMLIGAGLGGFGEGAGATIGRIRALANAPLVANLANYRDAFAAVPTQLRTVTEAMPTLQKYGIAPEKSLVEMQTALKPQIQQLGDQLDALEKGGVGDKTMPAKDVLQNLDQLRARYVTSTGQIPAENEGIVKTITKQMQDVRNETDANGNISYRDLRTFRDSMNRKTNWLNPDQDIYNSLGNIFRGGMEQVEPGVAELNRDYSRLARLDAIADKNTEMGRGSLPARFQQQIEKATAPIVGQQMGAELGGLVPLPGARFAGGVIGRYAYPKLSVPVYTALKNAADQGLLDRMTEPWKRGLQSALQMGDDIGVLRLLKAAPISVPSTLVAQTRRQAP